MSLQIKSLSKTYPGDVRALDNISLDIPKGVFGLLGPNGAGKTTLMNTLATLQIPDKGSIDFNGLDVLKEKEELRKILGYLPQEFGVYSHCFRGGAFKSSGPSERGNRQKTEKKDSG